MEKWEKLRQSIMNHGVYNSMLLALMPTANSSLILNNNESFEPFTDNIYKKQLYQGTFLHVNKFLIEDLKAIGYCGINIIQKIIDNRGSIQGVEIPSKDEAIQKRWKFLQKKYLTAYEIPIKLMIDFCASRNKFVCQSQSFNCFDADATSNNMYKFHIYGWRKGLKTGMYYLRQKIKALPTNPDKECDFCQ
jgi:ribonucleoside-diphosphate reductase alpha chain